MPKKFNRKNCCGCLRGQFVDTMGRTITIGGVHAFEYFIEVRTTTRIMVYHYPNGKDARKAFNALKRVK